jgi:hypothetical protein
MFAVAVYILHWWILVPLGVIVIFILVRFFADVYWDGKDKGKW